MGKSVWQDSIALREYEKLQENIKTDVLVIGAGLAGLLCAYKLKTMGVDCVLVEGNRICGGITKNTTAKITSQHGLVYNKLIRTFGVEKAKMYLEANNKALSEYKKLSVKASFDFEEKDSYIYSLDGRKKLENEIKALQTLGFDAQFSENPNLPFKTDGAVKFPNQAQFNPKKFAAFISSGLKIYENTFVTDVAPHTAWCENIKISAEKIIVATHFPFINKHGSYFLKMYQHRSYVIALENAPDFCGMYADEAMDGLSFRNYGELLLVGGGGHRTGKQGGAWRELQDFVDKYYPKASVKYNFATQDCMSLDGAPYIGLYSKNTPDLYVATGFNKWGMTSSMAAADILCDMVRGKENQYAPVFCPSRDILNSQLAVNSFEAVVNLLTPTGKRCPHLGCALKWNKAEHTWDCPCHGSRFERNGDVIDNPATGGAKVE